ncbi:MAG TPA: hypothetical protein VFT74_14100, partial [Isosphaeraceae bacterium]|nr:hypothetical protein [Isosphaeraceae bacterium]
MMVFIEIRGRGGGGFMDQFDEFLCGLLREGRIRFETRPSRSHPGDIEALRVLHSAFEVARREVAGPPITFDPTAAISAAAFVRQAAWAVLNRDEPAEVLLASLSRPIAPRTPSEHLSADLTLRYLPAIEARIQAFDPEDVVLDSLTEWFHACPLSGVLSSLLEGPELSPDLGNHPGLAMLY